jgi:Protein of unknown function (DUF1592)/Protein of unknown function (DUF1588)/Protein of unknown function (DUF1595)/Protein of unknown function (DUF1587)/Protein of unknown function (DUF1585)
MPVVAMTTLIIGVGCFGEVASNGGKPAAQPSGPGNTGDPGGALPVGPGGGSPPAMLPPSVGSPGDCQETAPRVTAARRLTREQYAATVRDLLGQVAVGLGADRLPADDASDGLFVSPATLIVSPSWAENALGAAEEIARAAVTKLDTLVPCSAQGATDGERCARTFFESFGKRAFRRPITTEELDGLLAVFRGGNASGGFSKGIELGLQAILQTPSFLYRIELGQSQGSIPGAARLTPYEVASRLSYGLWGTMPDDQLMRAADEDKLSTPAQLEAQARRMVQDPRARRTLVGFVERWFGLELLDEVMKDPARYPQFNEAMIAAMKREVSTFVEQVVFEGDGRFQTLLSAPYGYPDAALASLYGVSAAAGGKVALPADQRFGLLTNVGVLTAHTFSDESAAIHRGKFVRERLLCTTPPDPPADLMVEPPTPQPGVTTRQRLIQHIEDPACQPCHEYMDPIGFAFENYDGLGRWRTMEQGKPVDASGKLAFTDVDGSFQGVKGLTERLSASTTAADCVAGTLLRYAAAIESEIDVCTRNKLRAALQASSGDLRELLVAVTQTASFQYRRTGEVQP